MSQMIQHYQTSFVIQNDTQTGENNLDAEYKHRTGYEYAASEGPATKNDPKLARLRRFEFEGQQYEMWSHIKHGNRKGDQLRVHFAIDRDKRRIVIGWIGDHMDNETTRNIH